jgi:hypothetical protein
MDFDYKKYSLEQLENWVHDAVSGDASPQEIYDVIKGVVEEQYHYFKHHTGRCYELLALLNNNGTGHIKGYENNLECDKDDKSPECQNAWNDFWEENYYPEEVKDDGMRPWGHSDLEYLIANKKDKVKKWILPTELDGLTGDVFVNFPDDLLEAANLKEGDQIEWVDQGDGSYLLKKVEKKSQKVNSDSMTWDQAIASGWTMTADGFWIKE